MARRQKYTDEQKTAMIHRVDQVREQGHSLMEAIGIVKKEPGFEFASRPVYHWWRGHMQGKDWAKSSNRAKPVATPEKISSVVDQIKLTLDGGQGAEAPRSVSPNDLDAQVKLKALELLSKILG
jgi:hypothetical protein